MRVALVAAVVFGLSAVVTAQSSGPRSTGLSPRPSIGLPLPSIGLPLPSIGLPLPPIGLSRPLGLAQPGAPNAPARNFFQPPRTGDGRRGRRSAGTVLYFVPTIGWGYPAAGGLPGMSSAPQEQKRTGGRVRLEGQPGVDPQIFVDGYYVGTFFDVGGELALDAGPHHIELRADGYQSLEFDVRVAADRTIAYRGTLKKIAAALPPPVPEVSAPAPAPPAPSTIYVIPGCYVGNVLPADAGLPAGCDASRAIAVEPR